MKQIVVAVRDSAVLAFSRPFFVPANGAAVRSFSDEVNRQAGDNPMWGHPDDFELWRLATFDDEAGLFVQEDPTCICRGKDVAVRA